MSINQSIDQNYWRKSHIDDIYIELNEFQFNHKPFNDESNSNFNFVGRNELIDQVKNLIVNGQNNGAYLITGYRGMGKTSFINKVIQEADEYLRKYSFRKIRKVEISFGTSSADYNDVLVNIITGLREGLLSGYQKFLQYVLKPGFAILSAMIVFLFLIFIYPYFFKAKIFPNDYFFLYQLSSLKIIEIGALCVVASLAFFKLVSVIYNALPTIRVYNKLGELYRRSTGTIIEEDNINSILNNINFGIFSKVQSNLPPLTTKQIELGLADCINRLDRISKPIHKRKVTAYINRALSKLKYFRVNQIVFVFDEMDKINSFDTKKGFKDGVRDYVDEKKSKTFVDDQRERKQLMVAMISSMKSLISSVNAKFFFVAGREMFEAALADTADRDFSVGSIFHKIIYLDSFLKDKQGNDPAGLSNLIENYLKSILLPQKFQQHIRSKYADDEKVVNSTLLNLYYEFLGNQKFCDFKIGDDNKEIHFSQKAKIIHVIQHLIIYLTYRTNGSPKKMARIIEDLVVEKASIRYKKELPALAVCYKEVGQKRLFIKLDYKNQYRLGLVTYIFRPFLLNYSLRLKGYSDYLLVSTTYLFDHILKFHPIAFSSKNLELLPEMHSANRTPQLRNFIDDILYFLTNSYVRETEIRLFEYKFFNKITNELIHLANLFEEDSAAFNFTLDESHPIKSHVKRKLLDLRVIYKDFTGNYEYIHSIASLNSLLGDLRFFDQEYNDAITAYSDSFQALNGLKTDERKRLDILMIRINLCLKIGLTYEKIKTNDHSLTWYSESVKVLYELKELKNYEKNCSSVAYREVIMGSLQGVLASLFLVEKMNTPGVSLLVVNEEIDKIIRLVDSLPVDIPFIFYVKYFVYHQTSVLLFYKNTYADNLLKCSSDSGFCSFISGAKLSNDDMSLDWRNSHDWRFSNVALGFSVFALKNLILFTEKSNNINLTNFNGLSGWKLKDNVEDTILRGMLVLLTREPRLYSDANIMVQFAIQFSRIGNHLLSSVAVGKITAESVLDFDSLSYVLSIVNQKDSERVPDTKKLVGIFIPIIRNGLREDPVAKVRLVMICYFISSKFYSASSKLSECNSQLKRILRIFSSVCKLSVSVKSKNIFEIIEKYIFSEILRDISVNSQGTDRMQIMRFKHYFNETNLYMPQYMRRDVYSNLANNPEVRDAVILMAEIQLRTISLNQKDNIDSTFSSLPLIDLISPNNIITSQWVRINELRFQADLNYKIFKERCLPELECALKNKGSLDNFPFFYLEFIVYTEQRSQHGFSNLVKIEELVSNLRASLKEIEFRDTFIEAFHIIINSVHCLSHCVEILQNYGLSYPADHAFMARNYKLLGRWLMYFNFFNHVNDGRNNPEFTNKVITLIGAEQYRDLEPIALYQNALNHFRASLEMHREGKAYKQRINALNYLDDDFNDSLEHFAAALERQRINCGYVRTEISKIEKFLHGSKLLKFKSYVKSQ